MGLHIRMGDDKALAFYNEYFGQLVGAKITGFELTRDEDDEYGDVWPTYAVTLKDGRKITIEISQDEEGNGPGFIFGLEVEKSAS